MTMTDDYICNKQYDEYLSAGLKLLHYLDLDDKTENNIYYDRSLQTNITIDATNQYISTHDPYFKEIDEPYLNKSFHFTNSKIWSTPVKYSCLKNNEYYANKRKSEGIPTLPLRRLYQSNRWHSQEYLFSPVYSYRNNIAPTYYFVDVQQGNHSKQSSSSYYQCQLQKEFSKPLSPDNGLSNKIYDREYTPITQYDSKTLVHLAKNKLKGRYLQSQLSVCNSQQLLNVYVKISSFIMELIVDENGVFFVQNLLGKLPQFQKMKLMKSISELYLKFSTNMDGKKMMLNYIDSVPSFDRNKLILKLTESNLIELTEDSNGNHIVQKLIMKVDYYFIRPWYEIIIRNAQYLSKHKHGCCIIQKCLVRGSKEHIKQLLEELLVDITGLTSHPYGNYVVQTILRRRDQYAMQVYYLMKTEILRLACHKYGSNVIQELVKTKIVAEKVIKGILDTKTIDTLLNNRYGNYVLQTAMKEAGTHYCELRTELVKTIKPLLHGPVSETVQGKKILSELSNEL